MITFAFLFLGLILGVHEVELEVEGNVAGIQLLLDGEEVGRLQGEPWRLEIDFGPRLQPHNLQAVAFDASGGELQHIRQLINLPRQRAETSLILEGEDPTHPDKARVVWQHIEYPTAESVSFRLNGESIPLTGVDEVRLPAYDPATIQVIDVDVRFADKTRYKAELTFGGQTMFGADTELTGFALLSSRRTPPGLRDLEGRFRSGEEPLRVVGVEKSPARIVMVVDQTAIPSLRRLGRYGSNLTSPRTALREGEELVFLFPEVKIVETSEVPARLFSMTQEFTVRDGSSIPWILTRVRAPEAEPQPYRRISDAIAVAGIQAAQGNRPRAVVLVLGDRIDDTSAYGADEVKRFIRDLRVPLFIWWTGRISGDNVVSESRRRLTQQTPWGPADDISSVTRFTQATSKVRAELDSQIVVWIEGSYLPNEIHLAKGVRGIKPAG